MPSIANCCRHIPCLTDALSPESRSWVLAHRDHRHTSLQMLSQASRTMHGHTTALFEKAG